jgi:uridine kinase
MEKNSTCLNFAGIEKIIDLIDQTDKGNQPIILAIDGNSGAGKSYLADILASCYDCNVFHMDDFFLQPHQRTEERFQEPGGNVDYERFKNEVINNLKRGAEFSYQVYDCNVASLTEWINVTPKKLNIIEGVYSMHPLWNDIFDIKIFLTLQLDLQLERIRERNGEQMLKRFIQEWIPLENKYFQTLRIAEQCDLIIDTSCLSIHFS